VITLGTAAVHQGIVGRCEQLTANDKPLWGRMTAHEMVCHLTDAYKLALGEKYASPATGMLQRTLLKRVALRSSLRWGKNFPTRPEMEQGKGGTPPVEFGLDRALLLTTLGRFCEALPTPCREHPIFGSMSVEDWMRWGYLHADHHLRQFGR
jgi:hypothetical protein